MKITNIYPQAGADQTHTADVFEEIRDATLRDEAVLFLETHQYAVEEFLEEMEKGRFDLSLIKFLTLEPLTKTIHIPAQEPRGSKLVRASDDKIVSDRPPEARPATTKEIVVERYCDFSTKQHARHIASKITGNITMVVIWEPYVEAGDLDYLSVLPDDVQVVIFHRLSEQCGVVVTGDDDPAELFETQSTFENEVNLPWVIELLAHAGESTWFAALPKQMKTWVMMCVAKALLTGWSLFGDERFKVPNKAKRVIYLIPEAGRGSVKKRLKLLGLMEFLYDPITNPEGRLFVRTLSAGEKIKLTNPALLKLAKEADVFIDTAVRYLDGDENPVKDVKVLTENVLNLISIGARSVWVAHHAAKGFENATTMTLQNMFRGSGEFGAALTNAYGLCQTDEKTSTLHFHPIVGRDLDELIPDMILQGRPYLSTISNFKIVDANAEKFTGTPGPKDELRNQKIACAKDIDGSLQDKANAVNAKFGSKHSKSTICEWLKFDENKGATK